MTSGPPEFPGLIETSVCIKLSYGPSPNTLPFADNIPAVTVPPRPSGLPIATTQSPISAVSELPNKIGVIFAPFVSIFKSAKSVSGSVPIISALNSLSS